MIPCAGIAAAEGSRETGLLHQPSRHREFRGKIQSLLNNTVSTGLGCWNCCLISYEFSLQSHSYKWVEIHENEEARDFIDYC